MPTPRCPGPRLDAQARARLASGRNVTFMLELTVVGDPPTVRVTESEPRHVPEFCPDRHVYRDGSFCLGRTLIAAPTTTEHAREWWRLLGGYLDLQVSAALLGEWDETHAWPHGLAAHTLARAETIEASLPAAVAAVVRARDVPAPTRACPCGGGRPASRCHLPIINEVIALRDRARVEDDAYWNACAGTPCCGTLKNCRLRSSTPPIYRSRYDYLPARIAS
ncbi:MAG: E2 domain-containing protein [Kofleriaceae bacterium]|nr:E2 domain-containing protein [Kofleriaceae bacterium]